MIALSFFSSTVRSVVVTAIPQFALGPVSTIVIGIAELAISVYVTTKTLGDVTTKTQLADREASTLNKIKDSFTLLEDLLFQKAKAVEQVALATESLVSAKAALSAKSAELNEVEKKAREEFEALKLAASKIDVEALKAHLGRFVKDIETYKSNLKGYPKIIDNIKASQERTARANEKIKKLSEMIPKVVDRFEALTARVQELGLSEDKLITEYLQRGRAAIIEIETAGG